MLQQLEVWWAHLPASEGEQLFTCCCFELRKSCQQTAHFVHWSESGLRPAVKENGLLDHLGTSRGFEHHWDC